MKRPLRPCVYCGVPTFYTACRDHRDLLLRDPYYREARDGAVMGKS